MNLTIAEMVRRGYLHATEHKGMGLTSLWPIDGIRVFLVRAVGGPVEVDTIVYENDENTFRMDCKDVDTVYEFLKGNTIHVKVYRRKWVEITER